ncbi:MAG: alkaline phosphatase family protein, partial [FCB group bacterium]|nr:alkaline phosphatase family protein [FCB group bacterium]
MNKKVLILGLDGAALPLIEKWSAAGELPNFARLMNEGVWGKLKSTPSFGSASAWPSFHTGLNPGRHGMFDFFYQEKNSYNMQWMTKRYFTGKTFWETASEQNVKSTILNLPVTYPAA